jgi:hypothetical protein
MPSSRIPKSSSVTASGAKRPLRGPKNDLRLKWEESDRIRRGDKAGDYQGGGSTGKGTSYTTRRGLNKDKSPTWVTESYNKRGKPLTDKRGMPTGGGSGRTVRESEVNAGVRSKPKPKQSMASKVASGGVTNYAKNYFKRNSK